LTKAEVLWYLASLKDRHISMPPVPVTVMDRTVGTANLVSDETGVTAQISLNETDNEDKIRDILGQANFTIIEQPEPMDVTLTIEDDANLKSIKAAFDSATAEVMTIVDGEPQVEMLDVFEKMNENGVNVNEAVKTIKTRKSGKAKFTSEVTGEFGEGMLTIF
jgi:methionine synthase II (cobalamin-independent)